MILKIAIFEALILVFGFACSAQANPFYIESYTEVHQPETQKQFENELLKSYRFVTQIVADQVDREKCPIAIKFQDFKGEYLGLTPRHSTDCHDVIYLDSSLERTYQAEIVFAHELTHLLRHQHNPNEVLWLDEGIAKVVEVSYTGLWADRLEDQLHQMNQIHLSEDRADYQADGSGYVSSFFLVNYIYNRFSRHVILKKLISNSLSGWDNIESSIREMASEGTTSIPEQFLNRNSLWKNFSIALFANDTDFVPYGLFFIDSRYLQKPMPLIENTSPSSKPWSIRYQRSQLKKTSEAQGESKIFVCLDEKRNLQDAVSPQELAGSECVVHLQLSTYEIDLTLD